MMNQVISVVAVLALFVSTTAEPLANQPCSGKRKPERKVTSISLAPCTGGSGERGSPCRLIPNASANLAIVFETTQRHKKLDAAIDWVDGKTERPNFFALSTNQKNLCTSMTPQSPPPCPTEVNTEYTWSPVLTVPFQQVGVYHLRLKVVDAGKYVVCQEFYVRLTSDESAQPYCAVNKTKGCNLV